MKTAYPHTGNDPPLGRRNNATKRNKKKKKKKKEERKEKEKEKEKVKTAVIA